MHSCCILVGGLCVGGLESGSTKLVVLVSCVVWSTYIHLCMCAMNLITPLHSTPLPLLCPSLLPLLLPLPSPPPSSPSLSPVGEKAQDDRWLVGMSELHLQLHSSENHPIHLDTQSSDQQYSVRVQAIKYCVETVSMNCIGP